MRYLVKRTWLFFLIPLVLIGCAGLETPLDRFAPADLKLLRIETPEVIREDLPYEIFVIFQSRGEPHIKHACIRWVAEEFTSPSPALTCYAYEVSSDRPIGSACAKWLAGGAYSDISPVVCTPVENIGAKFPNSFGVKIQTRNVKEYYNRLDVYAEYLVNGEVRTTNTVSTKIKVER